MKFLPGLMFGDLRGSVGNVTASKNTYANYLRTKTSPVNPNTVAQQLVRARFGAAAQAWAGMTEAERLAWISIAPNWTNTNIFNNPIQYTGFNLFVRLARFLQEINEPINTTASLPATVEGFVTLTLTSDTTGAQWSTVFADPIPVLQKTIVWATAPLGVGTSFVKNQLRKIAVLDNTATSGINLTSFYNVKFGTLPPVGTKTFVQFRPIVIANGQPGVALKDSDIAV